MDFIERWYGVSPDGGSGSFEVSLVLILTLALSVGLVARRLGWTARRVTSGAGPKRKRIQAQQVGRVSP